MVYRLLSLHLADVEMVATRYVGRLVKLLDRQELKKCQMCQANPIIMWIFMKITIEKVVILKYSSPYVSAGDMFLDTQ